MVGKDIRIKRMDGLEIVGKLVKLDLQGVTYLNAGGEQAMIPLENVAILTFGEPAKRIDQRFVNDARQAIDALNRVNLLVNGSPTFSQYDTLVVDARGAVESFLSKYNDYEEQADFFDDLRSVLRSYELVRPLWATMQGADRRISMAESAPELVPILRMYPELRTTEYNQNGPIRQTKSLPMSGTGRRSGYEAYDRNSISLQPRLYRSAATKYEFA